MNTVAKPKKATEEKELKMRPIRQARITISIKSLSPLISNAWNEKGLEMMRMTATERKKRVKTARDPQDEASSKCYRTESGNAGINAMALKNAIIGAAHKDMGIEKTLVRKALFLHCKDKGGIIPIMPQEYEIREDIVRVGANQTDLRYRPTWHEWETTVTFTVDRELLSDQDLINLVNRAGFSIGIGEWRPEKDGEFGRFEVDPTKPVVTEDLN
jgi:hypothetical protein